MKKIFFSLSIILIIFFLGRSLNPLTSRMFIFHDQTQPARIEQFTSDLKKIEIPPRVAHDFNNKSNYPVFNFYAPFSYWVFSVINLTGISIIASLKISILIALLIAFYGSFIFLKQFFDFYPALLGGILYITSLYFPSDIFVRGNFGEIWFLALLPVGFYFVYTNSKRYSKFGFFLGALLLSFLFTSHNIYSLIAIPLIIVFAQLLNNKKNNLVMVGFSLLLTAYFWLPALIEMKYTIAKEMASRTNFNDHFLCWGQIWQSQWGFGGSTAGCISDGMSYMIGKIQIIFFVLGSILFVRNLFIKKNKNIAILIFFILSSIVSIFLTTYSSQFIWNLLTPFVSVIQFPWRFLGLSLLGISFISSYFFQQLKLPFKNLVIILAIVLLMIVNGKYFYGKEIDNVAFENKYLSQDYIEKEAAHAIPEYFPKNNVKINYGDTQVEKIGNLISIVSVILLMFYIRRK